MHIEDPWDSGLPYEPFMGRWSRKVAPLFLSWLQPAADLRWLDVGCGTGALSLAIVRQTEPREVTGIDPSAAFVAQATRTAGRAPRLRFQVASAAALPADDGAYDEVVSALALNFFPDPVGALREMGRVAAPGGEVAIYVWDYAAGMEMLRIFWDVAVALDPAAQPLDEKVRFPICAPAALEEAFAVAGLVVDAVTSLTTPTRFTGFDDFWQPFLGAVGPAPGYISGLAPVQRAVLADHVRAALPALPDGSIPLNARAWAVRARV